MPTDARKKNNLDEIIRLYQSDRLSLRQVGDRFGVSRQAIHSRLRLAGIETRPIARPPALERELLHRLYLDEGLSIDAIRRKLGISQAAVSNELKRHAFELRSGKPAIQIDRDLLYKLYVVDGLTQAEAGAKLGIGTAKVRRELRRHGIDHRHLGRPKRINLDGDLLRQLHVTERLAVLAIAKRLGISTSPVKRELRRHGIKHRVYRTRKPVP